MDAPSDDDIARRVSGLIINLVERAPDGSLGDVRPVASIFRHHVVTGCVMALAIEDRSLVGPQVPSAKTLTYCVVVGVRFRRYVRLKLGHIGLGVLWINRRSSSPEDLIAPLRGRVNAYLLIPTLPRAKPCSWMTKKQSGALT